MGSLTLFWREHAQRNLSKSGFVSEQSQSGMIITINILPLQPWGTIGTHQYPFLPFGSPPRAAHLSSSSSKNHFLFMNYFLLMNHFLFVLGHPSPSPQFSCQLGEVTCFEYSPHIPTAIPCLCLQLMQNELV